MRSDQAKQGIERTRNLSIGHVSPEAADGGPIALVQDGDRHPSSSEVGLPVTSDS